MDLVTHIKDKVRRKEGLRRICITALAPDEKSTVVELEIINDAGHIEVIYMQAGDQKYIEDENEEDTLFNPPLPMGDKIKK